MIQLHSPYNWIALIALKCYALVPPSIYILSQFFISELVSVVLEHSKDYPHCSYSQQWDSSFHLAGKLSNSTSLCIFFNYCKILSLFIHSQRQISWSLKTLVRSGGVIHGRICYQAGYQCGKLYLTEEFWEIVWNTCQRGMPCSRWGK